MQNANIPEQWRLVKVTWMQTNSEDYCVCISVHAACASAGQDLMKADSPLSTGQMMKSPTVSAYKCSFSAYRPAMQKRKRDKEQIGKEPACVPEDSETRAQETAACYAVPELKNVGTVCSCG